MRCKAETPSTSCPSVDVRRSSDNAPARAWPHVLHEVDALHEFHREEAARRVDHEFVQADYIGVRDTSEAAELLFQPVNASRGGVPQGLERHDLATGAVVNFIDDAHSPGTQPSEHREALRTGEIIVCAHR